jgi:hypothetical protein
VGWGLALLWANVPIAIACIPEPPDWWFTETFDFQRDFPPGVTLNGFGPQNGYGAEWGAGGIEVYNSSAIPLYILGQPKRQDGTVAQSPTLIPLYKVVSNMGFEWCVDHCVSDNDTTKEMSPKNSEQKQGEWVPFRSNRSSKTTAAVSIVTWELLQFAAGFDDHNQRADNRPKDILVPEPQRAHLILAYGDQQITAPFTVTYALHVPYDPQKQAKGLADCVAVYATAEAEISKASGGLLNCLLGFVVLSASIALGGIWITRHRGR